MKAVAKVRALLLGAVAVGCGQGPVEGSAQELGGFATGVSACATSPADSNNVGNWYTTNTPAPMSEWFQLVTPNGFSSDGCTYTGKIRWYYERNGWWISNRQFDMPATVLTISFNADGTVADSPTQPGGAYSYQTCGEPGWPNNSQQASLMLGADYQFHECLRVGRSATHPPRVGGMFKGQWQDDSDGPQVFGEVTEANPEG